MNDRHFVAIFGSDQDQDGRTTKVKRFINLKQILWAESDRPGHLRIYFNSTTPMEFEGAAATAIFYLIAEHSVDPSGNPIEIPEDAKTRLRSEQSA